MQSNSPQEVQPRKINTYMFQSFELYPQILMEYLDIPYNFETFYPPKTPEDTPLEKLRKKRMLKERRTSGLV